MPFVKVWIHMIWSTKNREKIIGKDLKPKLIAHILENAKIKEIYIDTINCETDHIHMLISLGNEQTLSKISQLIKGESSYWVNKEKLCKFKFEWQDEYIAVSVSDSSISKVRDYINNQEEHHRTKSFDEEYKLFIEKYGFSKFSG